MPGLRHATKLMGLASSAAGLQLLCSTADPTGTLGKLSVGAMAFLSGVGSNLFAGSLQKHLDPGPDDPEGIINHDLRLLTAKAMALVIRETTTDPHDPEALETIADKVEAAWMSAEVIEDETFRGFDEDALGKVFARSSADFKSLTALSVQAWSELIEDALFGCDTLDPPPHVRIAAAKALHARLPEAVRVLTKRDAAGEIKDVGGRGFASLQLMLLGRILEVVDKGRVSIPPPQAEKIYSNASAFSVEQRARLSKSEIEIMAPVLDDVTAHLSSIESKLGVIRRDVGFTLSSSRKTLLVCVTTLLLLSVVGVGVWLSIGRTHRAVVDQQGEGQQLAAEVDSQADRIRRLEIGDLAHAVQPQMATGRSVVPRTSSLSELDWQLLEEMKHSQRKQDQFAAAVTYADYDAADRLWLELDDQVSEQYDMLMLKGARHLNANEPDAAIVHYAKAKSLRPSEFDPANSLGISHMLAYQGSIRDHLDTAIDIFQQLASNYGREEHPEEWAIATFNTAASYSLLPYQHPDDYREEINQAHEGVLEVWDRESDPARWALIQLNRSIFLTMRHTDERNTDLQQALAYIDSAIDALSNTSNAFVWALAHGARGQIFMEMPERHPDQLHEAIAAYNSALSILTRNGNEFYWALMHADLCETWHRLVGEERNNYLANSIEHGEIALGVLSAQRYPYFRALVLTNLASALTEYTDLQDRGVHLTRALDYVDEAIRILDPRDDTLHLLPGAHNVCGALWLQIPTGDIAHDITNARSHLQQAAELLGGPEKNPFLWAMIQLNLGTSYNFLPANPPSTTLLRALPHLEGGLEVFAAHGYVLQQAQAMSNMAGLIAIYGVTNRAANSRKAIELGLAALELLEDGRQPDLWAQTQMNLGAAFLARPEGNTLDNIEEAIDRFDAAVTVFTPENSPEFWAMCQANLGNAWLGLGNVWANLPPRSDQPDAWANAIEHYGRAATVLTREDSPEYWLLLQNNLSAAWANATHVDVKTRRANAIDHAENTLDVWTRRDFPFEWARAQTNIGVAWSSPPIAPDELEHHYAMALACHERALEVRSLTNDPAGWSNSRLNAGLVRWRARMDGLEMGDPRPDFLAAIEGAQAARDPNKEAHAREVLRAYDAEQ